MAISERQMNTTPVMSLVIYVYFEILFTLLAGIQELKLSEFTHTNNIVNKTANTFFSIQNISETK